MGFFTDLKEDLAMAVNELMPEETEDAIRTTENQGENTSDELYSEGGSYKEQVEPEVTEEIQVSAEDFELDKMLDNLDNLEMEEVPEVIEAEAEEEVEPAEIVEDTEEVLVSQPEETLEEEVILAALSQDEKNTEDEGTEKKMDSMANRTVSDETAVITQGMVITGDIISEGSMDVIGTINGNIDVLGKLNVTGTIQGNSKASEIFADSAKITGEVVSAGSVKIGQSSVIIGNITATSAVIAGAVKGDIDVQGPVILDTSAIVMGNIKSKSVQINNGAVIEGMCSQCYADVNPTSFFEDLKKNK